MHDTSPQTGARAMTATLTIRKVITGYAYARNGNVGNPTPRVRWDLVDDRGCVLLSNSRLGLLKESAARYYPGASVKVTR